MLSKKQQTAISKLVQGFLGLSPAELRKYQETEVRTNFIDPLFAALGWKMDDRGQVERETTVEEGKRPDYIFKVNTIPQLYLEAKAFREDSRNLEYARDAITKAYNKGVSWAGVTNFSNLVVFDAYEEVASTARPRAVLDLTTESYAAKDSSLSFLTPTELSDGSLRNRAIETGIRRRPVPIEKRLYESMRTWRETLHNAIARFLDWQTDEQFRAGDEAIQRLIDRLIFLRNCEDRGIDAPQLRALSHKIKQRQQRNVYVAKTIVDLFESAAATYDSEIFQADALIDVVLRQLTARTDLDDILEKVVQGLFSVPQSFAEYNFAQMDADVLGQVYEQYLSYVPERQKRLAMKPMLPGMEKGEIALTAKKERRKEHGIYYTPGWVVQYIVENTVGQFLKENSKHPDRIDNLRVLDPACGSGSFLIRAYECLLQHHAQTLRIDVDDLPMQLRARILRRNIFGVDIDPQAVEIARLNLLIRMVRKREPLPELKDNIRLGNSILFGDEKQMRALLGSDYLERRPFDWWKEFPEIMNEGGFDVVIGNPPYVKEYVSRQPFIDLRASRIADYYEGKSDIWYAFACLAIDLLKDGGLHSFIATNNWNTNAGARILRRKILTEAQLIEYLDFGDHRVFETAGIQTMVYLLRKTPKGHHGRVRFARITDADASGSDVIGFVAAGAARKSTEYAGAFEAEPGTSDGRPFTFTAAPTSQLLAKIEAAGRSRLLPGEITQGIIAPQDSVTADHLGRLEPGVKVGTGIFVLSADERKGLGKLSKEERRIIKPYYTTQELLRFAGNPINRHWILYVTSAVATEISKYPNVRRHLDRFANVMTSDNRPYGLHRARNEAFFLGDKVVSLRKTDRPSCTFVDFPCYVSQTFFVIKTERMNPKFLCAVLNSKVAEYWFQKRGKKQGDSLQIDKAPLLEFPIRCPSAADPESRKVARRITRLVESLLQTQSRVGPALHATEVERVVRRMGSLEHDINAAVFDLYGLDASDRAVIESELTRK